MEAAKARDEVVEAVVEGHLRAIVAWPLTRPPVGGGTVRSRAGAACNGPRGSRVLGDDGYRQLADRGARDRSRWIVRGAGADASRSHLLDRAAGPGRPARCRGGRPGRVRSGVSGACRLRRGPYPRPATAAVAGDDRPQPLSLAADSPPARRADDAFARPGAAGRARTADR